MINALQDAIQVGIGVQAAAIALAAVGLNLQFGYTGLLNFGHVAFMLVGAYGAAITADQGGPLWLGVLVSIGLAVALGLVFGLPRCASVPTTWRSSRSRQGRRCDCWSTPVVRDRSRAARSGSSTSPAGSSRSTRSRPALRLRTGHLLGC